MTWTSRLYEPTGFDKAFENERAATAWALTLAGPSRPCPGQEHQSTSRALKLPRQPLPGLRLGRGRALQPGQLGGAVEPCKPILPAMPKQPTSDMLFDTTNIMNPVPGIAPDVAQPMHAAGSETVPTWPLHDSNSRMMRMVIWHPPDKHSLSILHGRMRAGGAVKRPLRAPRHAAAPRWTTHSVGSQLPLILWMLLHQVRSPGPCPHSGAGIAQLGCN